MDMPAAPAVPFFNALVVADRMAIDTLARTFFAAFCNADGQRVDLTCLAAVCLPEVRITKAVGAVPASHDFANFIAPREALLNGGRLMAFSEHEIESRTDVFGNVAQRWSRYAKRGLLDGVPFEGEGWKSIQCVRTPQGWRIAAVAWDDLPG
jgi:hypothetical protein